MVGSKGLYRTVFYSLPQSPNILLGSQRRSHAPVAIVCRDLFTGYREMMRGNFRRDADSLTLGLSNQFNGFCAGEVLDMDMASGLLCQTDILSKANGSASRRMTVFFFAVMAFTICVPIQKS